MPCRTARNPHRLGLLAIALAGGTLTTSTLTASDWAVPADADKVANPVAASPASVASGAALYGQYCAVCHGPSGKGDGAGGAYLVPKPTNLADPAQLKQSDGAVFWKLSTGRGTMIGWKPIIKEDDQRWNLVNYLRSLQPRPADGGGR